ncbi:MAG: GTP-binding protein [Thermodesulfobacteriota bacterium]
MRVKTFRGGSAKSVLEQVKAELGSEAVILDTQTRRENGRCVCEVTAALEAADTAQDADLVPRPGWAQWHQEWDQIKSHLYALARTKADLTVLTPRQRMPLEHLEAQGVADGAILALWRKLKDDRTLSALTVLGEMVGVKPLTAACWPQRLHALAGPSGCGKTSAVLRLALRAKRERARAKVLVVNADCLQGKGRLVLKHYAELSGLTYAELATAADLSRLVTEHADAHRIFVDLPALPADLDLDRYLGLLGLAGREDACAHLALPPHLAPEQYAAFLKRYRSAKTVSLVWTKLDEACRYGAVVNLAQATGLPVSALSFGPGLKDSLVPAERLALWRLLFKQELPDAAEAPARAGRFTH